MEQNPDEPPKADAIIARHRVKSQRKYRVGLVMIASGFVLPFLAFGLAHGVNAVAVAASIDHVPNQGVMILAYLGFLASFPVAVVLFVFGAGLAWSNRHS